MQPAFQGVRVLELGQVYLGPYCGLLFAQMGAEVIKVEPPGGEPLRFRGELIEEQPSGEVGFEGTVRVSRTGGLRTSARPVATAGAST